MDELKVKTVPEAWQQCEWEQEEEKMAGWGGGSQALSTLLHLNASTAGGNRWKCGGERLRCQVILTGGEVTMAYCH